MYTYRRKFQSLIAEEIQRYSVIAGAIMGRSRNCKV